ncbi:15168_t:CDS:2, partial [Gigaspora margarita]
VTFTCIRTTSTKWEINNSYQRILNNYYYVDINWISDEQTSKSYLYGVDANLTIFDSINLAWINSTSNLQNLLQGILATPNNQFDSVDNNNSSSNNIFDSINTKTDGVSIRWIVTLFVI